MFDPVEIGQRMKTQDNLATAQPYIICLQEKTEVATCDGGGDRLRYYHQDFERTYESEEDFVISAMACGHTKEEALKFVEELENYEVKDVWEDRNWFFTNEGYDEHLRLNKHNYGETRPYIKHLFRNPEMKAVWDLLTKMGLDSPKKEVENAPDLGDSFEGRNNDHDK